MPAISASGELGLLPPPLAGEGGGGGELAHINLLRAPSLSLSRKRGRGPHRVRGLVMPQYKRSRSTACAESRDSPRDRRI
jgi:hypothetical protein